MFRRAVHTTFFILLIVYPHKGDVSLMFLYHVRFNEFKAISLKRGYYVIQM